jgi:hypothetical protein
LIRRADVQLLLLLTSSAGLFAVLFYAVAESPGRDVALATVLGGIFLFAGLIFANESEGRAAARQSELLRKLDEIAATARVERSLQEPIEIPGAEPDA